MSELQGKTILVTGASSGIGREIAITLSKKGASVVITGRNEERLNDTYHCLEIGNDQSHLQIVADLNKDEQIEQLVANSNAVDGVVCCSGINDKAPINALPINFFFIVNASLSFSSLIIITKK